MALTIREVKEKIKAHIWWFVSINVFSRRLCDGAYVWATVVLLGGFGFDLPYTDFRLIPFILFTQFIRVTSTDTVDLDERKRQGALERFDLLAALDDDLTESISIWRLIRFYLGTFVLPSTVYLLMAFASFLSAAVRLLCLSVGNSDSGSKIMKSENGKPALFLFYLVALMEGVLSLSSLGFVISNRMIMKLFLGELYGVESSWGEQVILAIHYNISASIRRGTRIENLKIEVLPFALELFMEELQQNCHFGVLILSSLARGKGDLGRIMRTETLDAIINKPELVERLLAIASSREPNMEHFRLAAAQILLELCSVPQHLQNMTAKPAFFPAIQTLSMNLSDFCPSSSSGKRVQKRRSALEPMLKEIGSKIQHSPPPTPSASSSNTPPPSAPVDVSGFPPEQQQYYRDLALQNQQLRHMICTLYVGVPGFPPEQQQYIRDSALQNQQQYIRDLALQNRRQRDMIRTLQQEVENLKRSY